MMNILCEVSLGELVDKITILEIKSEKIKDQEKLTFIKNELRILNKTLQSLNLESIESLQSNLKSVNMELWEIEDKIRVKEKEKKFDQEFVELARSVYLKNDLRFDYKNKINISYKSGLREVKSYNKY